MLAEPVIEWSAGAAARGQRQGVARVLRLGKGCGSVAPSITGVRRYVGEGVTKVRQYAFEGVRDVDAKNNGARIYFHIRGRQPNSVTFISGAEKLPSFTTRKWAAIATASPWR